MRDILIGSSVLILALLLLRLVFRKKLSCRLQYALWGLVLFRLLIPMSFPVMEFNRLAAIQSVKPTVFQQGNMQTTPTSSREVFMNEPPIVEATDAGKSTAQVDVPKESSKIMMGLGGILKIVWIAGMTIVGLYFIYANLQFYNLLRKHRIPWSTEGNVKKIWMVEEGLTSPCLFGWSIYLTPTAIASKENLRYVLAHEETHARHWDPIWSLLRCVCLTIYWFNPLVWVAATRSKIDCELACDEGVLARMSDDERVSYGRTLISLISVKKESKDFLIAATTMSGDKRLLKERMIRIAQRPKYLIIPTLTVVALSIVLAVCSFAGAKRAEQIDAPHNSGQAGIGQTSLDIAPAHTLSQGAISSAAGRELSSEEIEQVNKAFEQIISVKTDQGEVFVTNPMIGFFCSYYYDVRDLNFVDFLAYYPTELGDTEVDETEFQLVRASPNFPFDMEGVKTLEDMFLPVHRHRRISVDETLTHYAGITTEDLTDLCNLPYLSEYDAWYNFTSDFGPGHFICTGGKVIENDTAILQGNTNEDGSYAQLTLVKEGDNWLIKSFLNIAGTGI